MTTDALKEEYQKDELYKKKAYEFCFRIQQK